MSFRKKAKLLVSIVKVMELDLRCKGEGLMNGINILIIEDDADIREGIRILLESENFCVCEAENGEEGLNMLSDDIGLVILDIMMPGISGLRVCEEIRKKSYVPILFLTAKARESDKLLGLMAGADDYLTKPFSYAELLGRVKAQTRRYTVYSGQSGVQDRQEESEYIKSGEIQVHTKFNEVFVNKRKLELTDIEYHMLLLMMQNKGKIFSAQNLYESIWNEPYFHNCNGTVMVHIRKLRVKIEPNDREPVYIKTIWGKGYCFEGEK